MRFAVIAIAIAGILAGCSSEQPLMTVDQQKTYNECMSGRWSGEADTMFFGPFGWVYHDSKQKDCLAKSGSIGSAGSAGQPAAAAPSAVQPATAGGSSGGQPASDPNSR